MKIGKIEVSSQFTDSFGATMKVKETGQYVERHGLDLELSESEKSIPGSKGLLGFYILTSNKVKHLFGVKTNPVHQ